MKRNVRVLLLGDERVGKSSIVLATLETQPIDIPSLVPPIDFPKELCFPEVSVTVVDTYYRRDREADESIERELKLANSIILVYDISRPETVERLLHFWLPLITMHSRAPIVLTGNKADLKPENQSLEAFEEMMRPIVKEWKQVEVVFEVTSKSPKLISNLFYYAQRVVLCPVSPLFDESERELTPQFRRALKYIFRKADVDRDFVLNDQEMLALNNSVFQNEQLDSSSLESLKLMIRDQCEDGVTEHGITYKGFLHLNQMIILRQKVATCWTMLKYYGFDDKLELSTSIELDPPSSTCCVSAEKPTCPRCTTSTAITTACGMTSPRDLLNFGESALEFISCIGECVGQLQSAGGSHRPEWPGPFQLASLMAFLDARLSIRCAEEPPLPNYPQNLKRAVEVLQKKDLLQKISRKVLCAYVVGASGVGE